MPHGFCQGIHGGSRQRQRVHTSTFVTPTSTLTVRLYRLLWAGGGRRAHSAKISMRLFRTEGEVDEEGSSASDSGDSPSPSRTIL